MKKTLQEIAAFVGGRIVGDASLEIHGLDNIDGAGPQELTFAVEPHIDEARGCKAAAVMLPEGIEDFPKTALYVEEPRAAFAKLLEFFTPKLEFPQGVSDKAHIGKDVKLGENVTIMPFAVVDDHSVIGSNVTLYPHTYIGQYVEVGDDTVIYSNATVREHCRVGKRCVIHSSAVIDSALQPKMVFIPKCHRSVMWFWKMMSRLGRMMASTGRPWGLRLLAMARRSTIWSISVITARSGRIA